MRTREQIEDELERNGKLDLSLSVQSLYDNHLILEALLDIRDLLTPKQ